MSDDHLSTETSISAELTETGVKAAAKSRAVSAVDRLIGNVADLGNAWLEGISARRRAKTEGERQLIEAAAKYGVERMNADDEFANRALENHFKKIAQQQVNKDAVVAEALEDLRQNPPSEEESLAGPANVSDEFMNRFEQYAESASTDELRQRWGRVLSSEVRKPGTFGAKVLRATDELDAPTAQLFERVCASRVRPTALAKSLTGVLSFAELTALISAELVVDPGIAGHLSLFIEGTMNSTDPVWLFGVGNFAIAFKKSCTITYTEDGALEGHNGTPALRSYILTDVGQALATILPHDDFDVFKRLIASIRPALPDGELKYFRIMPDGNLIEIPPQSIGLV
ncbi:DUF2806 domain-containing protein [Rhizobium sp. JAB6]|uniref:DUF2806 domain-containing protein n=1 Tax=Rhizobium sp. JAB6 TaxID=2127050 RepID=UPI0015E75569|nr:DUF2806 domain-containing protein [Rhizobium sp. JAB6]